MVSRICCSIIFQGSVRLTCLYSSLGTLTTPWRQNIYFLPFLKNFTHLPITCQTIESSLTLASSDSLSTQGHCVSREFVCIQFACFLNWYFSCQGDSLLQTLSIQGLLKTVLVSKDRGKEGIGYHSLFCVLCHCCLPHSASGPHFPFFLLFKHLWDPFFFHQCSLTDLTPRGP